MKKLNSLLTLILAVGIVLVSCNEAKKDDGIKKEATEQKDAALESEDKKAHDHGYEMAMSAYQCPMKCEGEKTYGEEGTCPKCKMDLKEIDATSEENAPDPAEQE